MKITSLCLAALTIFCGEAFGNMGVFYGYGHTLQLVNTANVQMVSEEVTISPKCGATPLASVVEFRCKFVLKNRTTKPVDIQVGFPLGRTSKVDPKWQEPSSNPISDYSFTARDGRQTYYVRYEAADSQKKFRKILLWEMTFASKESKTVVVRYKIPVSPTFGAFTPSLFDSALINTSSSKLSSDQLLELFAMRNPLREFGFCDSYEFAYVTETGRSWAGPIESATFRLNDQQFQKDLNDSFQKEATLNRNRPSTDATRGPDLQLAEIFKTPFRTVSPEGWKPASMPAVSASGTTAASEPNCLVLKYDNYEPKQPLVFHYYGLPFPQKADECEEWIRTALGQEPKQSVVLELRELLAAFFGVPPKSETVKDFASTQVWFTPDRAIKESELTAEQKAILTRLEEIANNLPADDPKKRNKTD